MERIEQKISCLGDERTRKLQDGRFFFAQPVSAQFLRNIEPYLPIIRERRLGYGGYLDFGTFDAQQGEVWRHIVGSSMNANFKQG